MPGHVIALTRSAPTSTEPQIDLTVERLEQAPHDARIETLAAER